MESLKAIWSKLLAYWQSAMEMVQRYGVSGVDVLVAASLLTRVPVPLDHEAAAERGAIASWAFPIVGALIGLAAGCGFYAATLLGVPLGGAAALALVIAVALSGALHEDGLADTADGMGGATTREKTLEIMRDSRIGAFGATALGVALLLRWNGIATLDPPDALAALVVAGAGSRALVSWVMWAYPPARREGMSASVGQAPSLAMGIALGLAILFALIVAPAAGLMALALAFGAVWAFARWVGYRLEGVTGDVFGACQQVAEIVMLLTFAAMFT